MSQQMASTLVVIALLIVSGVIASYLVARLQGRRVSQPVTMAMYAVILVAAGALWYIVRKQLA